MEKILVTGAGGFLAKALITRLLEQGNKVYALYHRPPKQHIPHRLIVLVGGDITKEGLGLEKAPPVDTVVHLAAKLSFAPRDKEQIFVTNYQGTVNLLDFMASHKIPRLFHISTAYLFDHNDYEVSKKSAEEALGRYPQIRTTIIRPSIIIGDSQVKGLPPLSGFYLGIRGIDRAKRWAESKLGLPPLMFTIRLKGRPEGKLNLIPVDIAASEMAKIIDQDKEGVVYLTHPNPPTLAEIEKPVSQAIGANIRIMPEFKPNPVERLASALMKGLKPYMAGANLPSDIDCQPLTEEFLTRTIRAFLDR